LVESVDQQYANNMGVLDSVHSLRTQLNAALWDRDCSFPLLPCLLTLHETLPDDPWNKQPLPRLPVVVCVLILAYVHEAEKSQYIKSDEMYCTIVSVGEVLGAAEKRVLNNATQSHQV
jgi:hypothetical protein